MLFFGDFEPVGDFPFDEHDRCVLREEEKGISFSAR